MHWIPRSGEASGFALQMGKPQAVLSVQVPLYVELLKELCSFLNTVFSGKGDFELESCWGIVGDAAPQLVKHFVFLTQAILSLRSLTKQS